MDGNNFVSSDENNSRDLFQEENFEITDPDDDDDDDDDETFIDLIYSISTSFKKEIIPNVNSNQWNALNEVDLENFVIYLDFQFEKMQVAYDNELFDDVAIRLGCIIERLIYQMGWNAFGFWVCNHVIGTKKDRGGKDSNYKDFQTIIKHLKKLLKQKNPKDGVWDRILKDLQKKIKDLRNQAAHPDYRGVFLPISKDEVITALEVMKNLLSDIVIMSELISQIELNEFKFLQR